MKLIGYAVKIGDGYVNKTDYPTMPIGWIKTETGLT